jgi:hypothetical protein
MLDGMSHSLASSSAAALLLASLAGPAAAQDAPPGPDPATTRLFFGPTARALPAGRAYLGGYQALIPFAQAGVTDRLSLGAGAPLPMIAGMLWITPKLQIFDTGRTQAAIGAVHAFAGGSAQGGIAYAVVTSGAPDASITVGLGVDYSGHARATVAMIGGERRVSGRSRFLTENYVVPGGGVVSLNGIRMSGRKLSADFGLGLVFAGDDVMPFPILNVAYSF